MGNGNNDVDTIVPDPPPYLQHYVDGLVYGAKKNEFQDDIGAPHDAVLVFVSDKGCLGVTAENDPTHAWVSGSIILAPLTVSGADESSAITTQVRLFATNTGAASLSVYVHCVGAEDDSDLQTTALMNFMDQIIFRDFRHRVLSPDSLASSLQLAGPPIHTEISMVDSVGGGVDSIVTFDTGEAHLWKCRWLGEISPRTGYRHGHTSGPSFPTPGPSLEPK